MICTDIFLGSGAWTERGWRNLLKCYLAPGHSLRLVFLEPRSSVCLSNLTEQEQLYKPFTDMYRYHQSSKPLSSHVLLNFLEKLCFAVLFSVAYPWLFLYFQVNFLKQLYCNHLLYLIQQIFSKQVRLGLSSLSNIFICISFPYVQSWIFLFLLQVIQFSIIFNFSVYFQFNIHFRISTG